MGETHPEPHLKLELLSQARFLAPVRALIGSLAQRVGFDEIHCGQLSLAVDEALCNIINHGYDKRTDGRIWLSIWVIDRDAPALRIVIEDRAKQVDPQSIKSRDLEDIRPGGLGVYIIRQVMDEARYEKREGGGMRLTMLKRVAPTNRPGRSEPGAASVPAGRLQAKDNR